MHDEAKETDFGIVCLVEAAYVDQEFLVVMQKTDALLDLCDLVVDTVHYKLETEATVIPL